MSRHFQDRSKPLLTANLAAAQHMAKGHSHCVSIRYSISHMLRIQYSVERLIFDRATYWSYLSKEHFQREKKKETPSQHCILHKHTDTQSPSHSLSLAQTNTHLEGMLERVLLWLSEAGEWLSEWESLWEKQDIRCVKQTSDPWVLEIRRDASEWFCEG